MLCLLTPASAGLRNGAAAGLGKAGLLGGTRWQHSVLTRPVRTPSHPKLLTRPRWFVVSSRWRRDGQKTTGSQESPAAGNQMESSPNSPKKGPASALRKMLPGMAKASVHENIYTLPNFLTASRLVAAPFIGYCILHDYNSMAFGLFAYAGITDLLDGWIARRWNLKTVVGTVIDPMADKTLMTVLTVALAMKAALPIWLAVIILGRDVGLAISAIYYRWISLPPPKTFARYWDFSLPSAEVRPTLISKYNTALQLGLMGLTTLAPVISAVDLGTTLGVMQYVVAATTVWSGASYIYSKDAVKILTPTQAGKEKVEDKQTGPR
ncbi:hypothetical protein N657DRAFT_663848 [Parathielavia appendiculata]|uniref:Cardiolipin synthase n=1 Tax=Parathielavia appendiculata TaxID=2587402 RepID=A0AAN6Z3J4_9PEZI|nr:hypothetical protein N657DRAFT_663848 [Parathielavia appendiculata]